VTENDLPEDLTRFIRMSVPSIDALEMLLFVVRRRGVPCAAADVAAALHGSVSVPAVAHYLDELAVQHVLTGTRDAGYTYGGAPGDMTRVIDQLVKAYNERPVTLIRTVYDAADNSSIKRFAEAFRIRKDP
jgi:hypothetical protein